MSNQFNLLLKKRFLPLFITQFFGAFNDNLFKNALVVLITFFLATQLISQGYVPQNFVILAGCLLILPMLLFSAIAGSIADKFEKSKLIQIIKVVEVLCMTLGAVGFILKSIPLLLFVLFLLGMHSTFFGPLKYSILPAQLHENELVGGNALIEMGTFLAILLGNILGAVLFTKQEEVIIIAGLGILFSLVGLTSSLFIPKSPASAPHLKLSFNIFKDSMNVINFSRQSKNVFLCILGISWFWFVGFIFLSEFSDYARQYIADNPAVYALILAVFSIGIAIGSGMCNRLLKSRIEATYVPLAALGMSVFIFDLYFATNALIYQAQSSTVSIRDLLTQAQYIRLMVDMLFIAICAGIYIVPLYAIIQHEGEETHKARIIASNNIMNALFMVVASVSAMIMIKLNFSIAHIFLTVGLINLLVVVQSCRLLPGALVKSILRIILKFLYKVEINELENFDKAGSRMVITPNHTSFIDGLLIAAFLPGKLSFAMTRNYATKWWVSLLNVFVEIFFLEPTNPYVIKAMVKYVKEGKKLVIFPEGRITVTGALMKIYEGPGMIADKADANILPILIEGAQYTPFSRLKGRIHTKWFPKITLTLYPAQKYQINPEISGRKRRQIIGENLYKTMANITFLSNHLNTTLFQSLLEARKMHGGNHKIIEDIRREPLTYNKLILGSIIIGRKIKKLTTPAEAVGILLPNINANPVTLFGLQAYQRVAAMLNFSTGTQNVILACQTAKISLVCTSKAFIETAKLESMINALQKIGMQIIYLEDLKANINLTDKFMGWVISKCPPLFGLKQKPHQAKNPAVILFTSGSEGTPKAVVLSSRNIHANKGQLSSRVDFSASDIVLNALPIFHSFGLTAGTLLPLLYGMKVFLYPSPLHYRIIPELSYDINATILFGTNTFLAGYAKYAHPYDFYSIRYVYAGAEKLKEETRRLWADKFGVRIFEGYGATETSPVIAANTPMHNRPGTVGKLMPDIEYRLELVPDIKNAGRLHVKGPNIMLGYMLHHNPGVITPPPEGWYDTGDIVSFDEDGYITIQGRAKRFAKIAGEMVSLTYVENFIDKLWPDDMHAVVALSDPKKGEQLVLITTHVGADKTEIIQSARQAGISELLVPKIIHIVDKLPLLGTGKIDYPKIHEMLADHKY